MTTVIFKLVVAASCDIACILAFTQRDRLARLPQSVADRLLALAFVIFRLGPFITLYILFDTAPRSDVPVFYEAARHAMQGEVVYRDFWSPYSPLFAYLTALPLWVWKSPKAIIFLMIVVEGIAWWLTYRFYRSRLGGTVQASALLYLLLPAPLVFCILGGQEDVWMWAVAVGSLWSFSRWKNSFWLGMWMIGLLLATKALGILIVLTLLIWIPRRSQYLLGLLVAGLPALAVLYYLTGTGVLTPLMFANMPFAPNLWTVLAPVIGNFMSWSGLLSAVGLAAVLILSGWGSWYLRQARVGYEKTLPLLWILCYGFMMFVHKSSLGNYAFIYMLPLVLAATNWHNRLNFCILVFLNTLVAVQPSYWYAIHSPLFTNPSRLSNIGNLVEYLMEWGIVLSVGFFVWQTIHEIQKLKQPTAVTIEKVLL